MIPLLKRMVFLESDGSPTSLYDQFRNEETSGMAIAEGMKHAFSELFDKNEYVYTLSEKELLSLVVQITGGTKNDRKIKAIVRTFTILNGLADFESDTTSQPEDEKKDKVSSIMKPSSDINPVHTIGADNVDFRVSYTINLNLPETTNPDVFNAIFKSLKENILKN